MMFKKEKGKRSGQMVQSTRVNIKVAKSMVMVSTNGEMAASSPETGKITK